MCGFSSRKTALCSAVMWWSLLIQEEINVFEIVSLDSIDVTGYSVCVNKYRLSRERDAQARCTPNWDSLLQSYSHAYFDVRQMVDGSMRRHSWLVLATEIPGLARRLTPDLCAVSYGFEIVLYCTTLYEWGKVPYSTLRGTVQYSTVRNGTVLPNMAGNAMLDTCRVLESQSIDPLIIALSRV